MADPLPMLTLFDKLIQLRMGQANSSTPWAYETFPKKEDDAIKIVFEP